VLVVLPKRRVQDDPSFLHDYKTPGFVLIGAGAAVAITGAVLLGLGVKRAKQRSVALWPTGTGAAIVGRF
jgi:hypothetical protein